MKQWFYQRFLPMWAKQTVLYDNRSLERENQALKARIRELESYIRGMHRMCRTGYGKGKAQKGEAEGTGETDFSTRLCNAKPWSK